MEIQTQYFEGYCIVTLAGDINSSDGPEFVSTLDEITSNKIYNIGIDMELVDFFDAAGYRAILNVQNSLKNVSEPKGIALITVNDRIRTGLESASMTSLYFLLNIKLLTSIIFL